ncbi:unnamed protein product [Prorocentrum cordatum]|uniref:Uncharacterized protein n=1 Tax=Prorocentrum cordatum TaxID=2364126 RepID=A0ABN9YFS0_9DINO|nr:unnamed protein product [Polarella glacialis]CAK0911617.1 unnamed protein product [Polarella glacialis]
MHGSVLALVIVTMLESIMSPRYAIMGSFWPTRLWFSPALQRIGTAASFRHVWYTYTGVAVLCNLVLMGFFAEDAVYAAGKTQKGDDLDIARVALDVGHICLLITVTCMVPESFLRCGTYGCRGHQRPLHGGAAEDTEYAGVGTGSSDEGSSDGSSGGGSDGSA